MVSQAQMSPHPIIISIGSVIFAGLTNMTIRQTYRQTTIVHLQQ